MPQLRVKNGPAQGKTYDLTRDVVRLGREGEVQVLDTLASRQHAEVFAIGDMYFIRDLASRNGTFVNDERLKTEDQALLRVGDLIRIGTTHIVFEDAIQHPIDAPEITSEEEDFGATMELSLDSAQVAGAPPATADPNVHFALLCAMAKAISTAFDQRGLMSKLCDLAMQATPAEEAYVFMRDQGKLVPWAHRRRAEHVGDVKISGTIIKRSIQHSRSVLVSDALSDSRFSASRSVVMRGIRSVVCAPLLAHDHVAGVLYLHSSSIERSFNDDHLRLVTALALQAAVATEAIRAHEESRNQLLSVFRTLLGAHEQAAGAEHVGHSERVHACARGICRAMEVQPPDAHRIELAALLHEIGKIGAPEGAFEREENRCAYATLGADMLRHIQGLENVAEAVEGHLERLDGSGGPKGLIGHQVALGARVVGLADEFSRRLAAAPKRVKRSETVKGVLMALNEEAGEKFDPEVFNGLVVALRTGALRPA